MKIHEIKCWPIAFEALRNGSKPWEYRLNDRDYEPGDILWLREWDPTAESYTGRHLTMMVGHTVYGPIYGIPDGFCVMTVARAEIRSCNSCGNPDLKVSGFCERCHVFNTAGGWITAAAMLQIGGIRDKSQG